MEQVPIISEAEDQVKRLKDKYSKEKNKSAELKLMCRQLREHILMLNLKKAGKKEKIKSLKCELTQLRDDNENQQSQFQDFKKQSSIKLD